MMMSLSFQRCTPISFCILMVLLLCRLPLTVTTVPIVPAVIIFGDSIVDTGNNNLLVSVIRSNFPPYGRDFKDHEPTGRFSNGRVTSDFIASKLGVKELVPSYSNSDLGTQDLLTGVSFASGGTGYDPLTSGIAAVIPMSMELKMFQEYQKKLRTIAGEKNTSDLISNSLFMICCGSNDVVTYFNSPLTMAKYDIPAYAQFLVQAASSFVQEIIKSGATKIGVMGIPPIGCVPSQRTQAGGPSRDCASDRNKLANDYNANLAKEIERLNKKSPVVKLIYIDIYSPLLDLIEHPGTHGFEFSTKGCCGTGDLEVSILCNPASKTCPNASKYVFWDSYHPTEKAYEILVDELLKKYIHYLN